MASLAFPSADVRSPSIGAVADRFLARAWHALDIALQPIVDMRTGRIYGYEALMRGHAILGLESIAAVLDRAHEIGAADRLHLLLMRKAFEKLALIDDEPDRKLFFNLDGRALGGRLSLHEETAALLADYEIDPGTLCLEFSETYDYASASEVARMVTDHRRMGVRFAIDDFGRGYSELKVLYEYHPEFIKIDRFFVSGMMTDCRKRLFVSTLVNLAHVLGIRVIAEGIETAPEYELIWQLDCDLGQGFFISPPQLTVSSGAPLCPNAMLHAARQPPAPAEIDALVFERLEPLKTVRADDTMLDVVEAFGRWKTQSAIPVLNALNEPVGILRESDLKEFIYAPFGRDLLKNSAFDKDLQRFVTQCPIADINASATVILDTFTYHPNADGVIVTDNSKYVGFLSALALLEIIADKRVEAARDQNPLSKLPGNVSISRYSDSIMNSAESNRYFCYVDFDNFKPFNDTYSFLDGDRAIVMFADLLRQHFFGPRFMVGHIGGDDFFVGAQDVAADELVAKLSQVRQSFAKSVESLYSAEDRARGHIEARDRYGELREFPLLTCAVAIMEIPKGVRVDCIDVLLHEITRTKREAKKSDTGLKLARFRNARPHTAGALGA